MFPNSRPADSITMLQLNTNSWFSNIIGISHVVGMMIGVTITFATLETNAAATVQMSDSLQVCADTMPSPDRSQVALFWESDENSTCSYVKTTGPETFETVTEISNGYVLLHVNQSQKTNITIKCEKDSQAQSGTIELDQSFNSNECTSSAWLKKRGVNSLTICLDPLEHLTKLSWNASTPLERCSFINESAEGNISTVIHVLPLNVSINLDKPSRLSRFFVQCKYPASSEFHTYTVGPVSYSTEKTCSTTKMEGELVARDDGDPTIASIHQYFVPNHVGLFVIFIVATLVVIGIFSLFVFKRFRRERWRRHQRLLVNEESDDAALREYQEMAT